PSQCRGGAVATMRGRRGDLVFTTDADQVVEAVELAIPPAAAFVATGCRCAGFDAGSGEVVTDAVDLRLYGMPCRTLDAFDLATGFADGGAQVGEALLTGERLRSQFECGGRAVAVV